MTTTAKFFFKVIEIVNTFGPNHHDIRVPWKHIRLHALNNSFAGYIQIVQ